MKNENELIYKIKRSYRSYENSLYLVSRPDLISRAQEIAYKQMIYKSLLSFIRNDRIPSRLFPAFYLTDNLLDVIYLQMRDRLIVTAGAVTDASMEEALYALVL